MADHNGNHRCLVERNVPIVLILSSRWRDGAESLGNRALAVYGKRLTSANIIGYCVYQIVKY